MALDIGPGDEVSRAVQIPILRTWLAVSHAGAIPVPVETKTKETCNIDGTAIESAISGRNEKGSFRYTLYGQPADLDPDFLMLHAVLASQLLKMQRRPMVPNTRERGLERTPMQTAFSFLSNEEPPVHLETAAQ